MVNEELVAQNEGIVVLDDGMESPDGVTSCCWMAYLPFKG